jgi:hypothetical protein
MEEEKKKKKSHVAGVENCLVADVLMWMVDLYRKFSLRQGQP